MPSFIFRRFAIVVVAAVAWMASPTILCAADADTNDAEAPQPLTIGSPAPALDVEHWISDGEGRFEPITDFESDRVYVVEFWATWCGPCIASMPHLVELQKEFADRQVQVISISDEDMETVDAFLKRPYTARKAAATKTAEADDDGDEDGGEDEKKEVAATVEPSTYGELTSAYCLTTDPDRSVFTSYMKAAAQNGIPTSFIVGKSGLVEWIGHPMRMDEPLLQVVDGTWDRDEFAEEFKREQMFDLMIASIMKKYRAGEMELALEEIEAGIVAAGDDAKSISRLQIYEEQLRMMMIKKKIAADDFAEAKRLLEIHSANMNDQTVNSVLTDLMKRHVQKSNYDEAANVLADIQGRSTSTPSTLNQIAWEIYELKLEDDQIPDSFLDAAVDMVNQSLEAEPNNGSMLDTLAHLEHVRGNLDRAIEVQTKAIANADNPSPGMAEFLKQIQAEKMDESADESADKTAE